METNKKIISTNLCISSYPTKRTKETLVKESKALKLRSWVFHSSPPGKPFTSAFSWQHTCLRSFSAVTI